MGKLPQTPVSAEGVDLTLIRQLLAMTPTDRALALKSAANNLLRARRLATGCNAKIERSAVGTKTWRGRAFVVTDPG